MVAPPGSTGLPVPLMKLFLGIVKRYHVSPLRQENNVIAANRLHKLDEVKKKERHFPSNTVK